MNKKKNSKGKIGVALGAPKKVAELLVFARVVHDDMAANGKLLPTPSPALSVLQTHTDDLANKEALVRARMPNSVDDRDAAIKVLMVDLHNERAYVELVANADPANAAQIAGAAGMSLRKTPAPSKPPLAVKAGAMSGSLRIVAKAAPGGKANDWQMSADGGKTWVDLPGTTKAKTQVANLTPGAMLQFRHRAVTKNGVTDWSLPVPHVVQ